MWVPDQIFFLYIVFKTENFFFLFARITWFESQWVWKTYFGGCSDVCALSDNKKHIITRSSNSILRIYNIWERNLIYFMNIRLMICVLRFTKNLSTLLVMEVISCLHILIILNCTKRNGNIKTIFCMHKNILPIDHGMNSIHDSLTGSEERI